MKIGISLKIGRGKNGFRSLAVAQDIQFPPSFMRVQVLILKMIAESKCGFVFTSTNDDGVTLLLF